MASGPPALTTVQHRLGGFVETLDKAGIPASQVEVTESVFSEEGGYAAGRHLAGAPRTASALFCVSDVMAIGALTALHEGDVAVPTELSVIGYESMEAIVCGPWPAWPKPVRPPGVALTGVALTGAADRDGHRDTAGALAAGVLVCRA